VAQEILSRIQQMVVEGEPQGIEEPVRKALVQGIEPLTIINEALIRGISIVGEEFEKGNYFLPDLILGARAMEAGLAILEPLLLSKKERRKLATVVMGTVEGDLHEIGKNIVITMFKANGFEVYDLGVDVPTARFIEKISEVKPDIVGVSALLTTTIRKQKDLIETLKEEGLRHKVKVMVGGAPITRDWAEKIGADGYAPDASQAVHEAKRLLGL